MLDVISYDLADRTHKKLEKFLDNEYLDFFELPNGTRNEIMDDAILINVRKMVISGSSNLSHQSASDTSTHYRINAAPTPKRHPDLRHGIGLCADGDFPVNSAAGYTGDSRQIFLFQASTAISVEKAKIDAQDGQSVLEKAINYFNQNPITLYYQAEPEITPLHGIDNNTKAILKLMTELEGIKEKDLSRKINLGDISRARPYTGNFKIQRIDDYYRHINFGAYTQYNFFRQTELNTILAGHKYFIDVTVRSTPGVLWVGFGTGANNSVRVSAGNEEFVPVRALIQPPQNYTNFGAYLNDSTGQTGHYVDIKADAAFCDLTAIFGAGNEPTETEMQQVLERYPNIIKEGTAHDLAIALMDIRIDEINTRIDEISTWKNVTGQRLNEIESSIEALDPDLDVISSPGYYYRGIAPAIPVGDEALSYSDFITQTWETLRAKYPDYISREVVSKDQSNTFDIYEYTFTPPNFKETVFLISGVHGDEYEGFWGLYYFMKNLCENSYKHARLRDIKHDIRFVVIPVVNPWGLQNKKRRNSRGIDPNANYDVFFGEEGYASEGTEPFSEKESLAVKTVGEKYDFQFSLFADIHTDPYSPTKGNYLTIVETSSLWDEGVKLTLDEIDYLKHKFNFTTSRRPNIVNISQGCGAWRYMEIVKGVPSLIWETSIGLVAETGTSKMMTIAVDWLTNVITQMLKVGQ